MKKTLLALMASLSLSASAGNVFVLSQDYAQCTASCNSAANSCGSGLSCSVDLLVCKRACQISYNSALTQMPTGAGSQITDPEWATGDDDSEDEYITELGLGRLGNED